MNILSKIVSAEKSHPMVNPKHVEMCFAPLQAVIKPYLEMFVPSLIWREQTIESVDLNPGEFEEKYARPALHYGFGKSDTDTEVIISVDAGIAHAASSIAFTGIGVLDSEVISKLSLSQLDIFLMEDLIESIIHTFSGQEYIDPDKDWSKWKRKNSLFFGQFVLSNAVEDWIQVVLPFEGKPLPEENMQAKVVPKNTKTKSKKQQGKKPKPSDKVSGTTSWPQSYDIRILMPRHVFDGYVSKVDLGELTVAPMDIKVSPENWSRRISPTQTRLRCVLESCRMSVADCTRLEIGQVLSLPGASLKKIKIEAEFKDKRQVILEGAMGQHKSHKAVRLQSSLHPSFIGDHSKIMNTSVV
jgi:flagellar motor switch/type III secretory pathway protein FliN